MDRQELRQAVLDYLTKFPLDDRVIAQLWGFKQTSNLIGYVSELKGKVTADQICPQVDLAMQQLDCALRLCQPSGDLTWEDFARYIQHAEGLISHLCAVLPRRGS